MGFGMAKFKSMDFYRKIPRDLTEATVSGAGISLIAALMIAFLFGMELTSYLSVHTTTQVVVDRSSDGDLLRINFNISLPALSCEFASLDVSDTLGAHRINLTKTVRKWPINADYKVVGPQFEDKPSPVASPPADEHAGHNHGRRRLLQENPSDADAAAAAAGDAAAQAGGDAAAWGGIPQVGIKDANAAMNAAHAAAEARRAAQAAAERRAAEEKRAAEERAAAAVRRAEFIAANEARVAQMRAAATVQPTNGDNAVAVPQPVESSPTITEATFNDNVAKYPVLIVNFFAPWCPWSQRLAPIWEEAASTVDKNLNADGKVKLAKVDCTADLLLCRRHHVQGFPSIRVFRQGNDVRQHGAHHEHESYYGQRTVEDLVKFAMDLVPAQVIDMTDRRITREVPNLERITTGAGCAMEGFVLVKKVPGNMHISAHAHGFSFDYSSMNVSHLVHHLSFGRKLPESKLSVVQGMMGIDKEHPLWDNRMDNTQYISQESNITHEHYLQVVLTTVEPRDGRRINMYEYTHHSHAFKTSLMPMAKFSYDPSPMQIVIAEDHRSLSHFLTQLCAIIGGVFTVAGILDSMLYAGYKLYKKSELGKLV